jgi:hypothetical protein
LFRLPSLAEEFALVKMPILDFARTGTGDQFARGVDI